MALPVEPDPGDVTPSPPDREGSWSFAALRDGVVRAPVLYPNEYVWFVFVSAMDVMLTWAILRRQGTEVNPVARMIIERWDLAGAIVFKFTLMIFVIVVCEFIGRARRSMRWLACLAVAVSAIPVVYSLGLLTWHVWVPVLP